MAATMDNWVHEKGTVFEKDKIMLEQVKKKERKDEKLGYKWVRVDPRTTLFVECDKHGNPTKRGLEKINKLKSYLNIK